MLKPLISPLVIQFSPSFIQRYTRDTPVEIKALTFLTTVNQLKFIFCHSIAAQTQSCHLRAHKRNHTPNMANVTSVQSYLDE